MKFSNLDLFVEKYFTSIKSGISKLYSQGEGIHDFTYLEGKYIYTEMVNKARTI